LRKDALDIQKSEVADSSKPNLYYVPPDSVPTLWGDISSLLNRTPDDGALFNWDEQELFQVLTDTDNSYGLWVGYHNKKLEAVIITCFLMPFANGERYLQIESGNGKLHKYRPYLERIEKWAFDCGCTFSQIKGRFGLARVLEPCGYIPEAIVLKKSLRKRWSH
jgi:hypothetical protein